MRRAPIVYCFGPFELDPSNRQLLRGSEHMHLGDTQTTLLLYLVSHAPAVVSKDTLAGAVWGAGSSDNSVEQTISRLRKALGNPHYIETVRSGGYRFTAPVEQREPQVSIADTGMGEEPFRAFVQGRRELATLNRRAIDEARRAFEHTIKHAPDYVPAHVGLANACALAFEASRVDSAWDLQALGRAVEHARRATALNPAGADAWSTLGFALSLSGDTDAATAAAWKAVGLEAGGWRHWLRLAFVCWGEERIESAHTALTLCPDLALAHWLKATVLVARGAFDAALRQLRAGCAAQDKQRTVSAVYPAVGLHLLHGLVLAAQDRLDEAAHEFQLELAGPDRDQLYFREASANTWYAIGAVHVRRGQIGEATSAFRRALEIAPGHLLSMAALGLPIPDIPPADPRALDAAIARAIGLTRAGRHRDAAARYREAVSSARAHNAGWILPVEPIIHTAAHSDTWIEALAIIQQRAS